MATVKYKCDKCAREIDIPRNPQGLEVVGPCRITDGCKGRLTQQSISPTARNSKLPADAEGLNNWVPRRVFYKHEQSITSTTWIVQHDLNVQPTVTVHTYDSNNQLVETDPLTITFNDPNTVTLTFNQPAKGFAQCIARSTNTAIYVPPKSESQTFNQISVNQYMTVLVHPSVNPVVLNSLEMKFISLVTGSVEPTFIAFSGWATGPYGDIWSSYTEGLYKGKTYTLYRTSIVPPFALGNGSPFFFDNIGFDEDQVLILFSNSPYQSTSDLALNKFVSITDLADANTAAAHSYWEDNQIFVDNTLIRSAFPAIRLR